MNPLNIRKINQLWSDGSKIAPVRKAFEPITYVPETGFFRQNIPSPWDKNLSEGFNYGKIPETSPYSHLEKQPGQNAWQDDFTGVDAQLVTSEPDLNAYSFEATKYNRYKPRQARLTDTDDDTWEPWSNPGTPQVVESSPVVTQPKARRAAIVDDDIDIGDLEYFANSVPQNPEFVEGLPHAVKVLTPTVPRRAAVVDDDIDLGELDYSNNSVPANTEFVESKLPASNNADPYDFDAPQYAYRAEDDINNWRSGTIAAPEPNHTQLEIDFNNPLYTNDLPLPHGGESHYNALFPLEKLKLGWREGNSFGVGEDRSQLNFDPSGKAYYSKSIVFDRAPKSAYNYLDTVGQAGFIGGRVVADIYGNGTRKYLWNIQPEDFTNTEGKAIMNHAGASRTAQLAIPYAATLALGIGSGNYNPLNVAQGGRPDGFSAVNPNDDPRNSTSPLYDMAIERGMLGRRGRLLPWEQFHQERPEVSFEQYDKYNRYLTNKDDNLLRQATGGLAKGTLDGINGPEVSVMGYSVNPLGAAAAAGIIALGRKAILR